MRGLSRGSAERSHTRRATPGDTQRRRDGGAVALERRGAVVLVVGGADVELDVGRRKPGRVRTKATTSATVEVSGPLRRSSHSAIGLGLSAP